MPQIWLDAEELAAFTSLTSADARIHSIQQGWARMRCRNGITRTRLPAELVGRYLQTMTQMEAAKATSAPTWNALRTSLLALIPGAGLIQRQPASSINRPNVASHHGLAALPLLTKADQNEAA